MTVASRYPEDQPRAGYQSPGLWITGLGSAYPQHILGPEKLASFAERFYDVNQPGLKKLLEITRSTGIETRSSATDFETDFCCNAEPPTIEDMDVFFREAGVELAVEACDKALADWGGSVSDITHTVSVTCTNSGLPGYDRFVAERLGLSPQVNRVLLGGTGCAGGMAIMRVAAEIASGATARGKIARVLAFACELCSPNARHDLAQAEKCADPRKLSVAAALFSDGAAAFILSNDNTLDHYQSVFQVHDWGQHTIPGTEQYMSFNPDPMGYTSVLHRDIPSLCVQGIKPLLAELMPSVREALRTPHLDASEFDWAVHPGGKAIIKGTQTALGLTDEQIQATQQIYKTRGNSSSATVLIVLDLLRQTRTGREHVGALAFGPGLTVEMAFLTRCR